MGAQKEEPAALKTKQRSYGGRPACSARAFWTAGLGKGTWWAFIKFDVVSRKLLWWHMRLCWPAKPPYVYYITPPKTYLSTNSFEQLLLFNQPWKWEKIGSSIENVSLTVNKMYEIAVFPRFHGWSNPKSYSELWIRVFGWVHPKFLRQLDHVIIDVMTVTLVESLLYKVMMSQIKRNFWSHYSHADNIIFFILIAINMTP